MTPDREPRRSFGSVYQHPRSRFLWIRYTIDGQEHRESARTTSLRAAEELLAQRKAELGLGVLLVPQARRVTFEGLVEGLRADYELKGNRSLGRAELAIRHLRAHFGPKRAIAITAKDVRSYQARRKQAGASAATINFESAILRRMFNLAVANGELPAAPAIATPSVDNARQGFVEPSEFRAVHAALPDYLQGPILFAWIAGWRLRAEILTLPWSAVDFAEGVVRLAPRHSKNKRGRALPFSAFPELATLLRTRREATTALERAEGRIIPLVFHHAGQPIVDYRKAWRSACRAAATGMAAGGLSVVANARLLELTPHDLRRSAVRGMVRAGISERVAMEIAGFRSRSIFDRYQVVALDDQRAGLERLSAYLSDTPARTPAAHPSPRRAPEIGRAAG